ncbi:MAG TPA: hypothetical protein EYQ62_09375 [Verrucomicrobiales bacterium]|nr:hypothetical protein [Verrucomicrobiales bacterium]
MPSRLKAMPLARFIMVLLLSCLCVQGTVYRITGVKLGSGGKWYFEGGSTKNGRSVGGQFASYAEVRAFSKLSTNRRYAVPAAVRRSQRIDLRRRPISRR